MHMGVCVRYGHRCVGDRAAKGNVFHEYTLNDIIFIGRDRRVINNLFEIFM